MEHTAYLSDRAIKLYSSDFMFECPQIPTWWYVGGRATWMLSVKDPKKKSQAYPTLKLNSETGKNHLLVPLGARFADSFLTWKDNNQNYVLFDAVQRSINFRRHRLKVNKPPSISSEGLTVSTLQVEIGLVVDDHFVSFTPPLILSSPVSVTIATSSHAEVFKNRKNHVNNNNNNINTPNNNALSDFDPDTFNEINEQNESIYDTKTLVDLAYESLAAFVVENQGTDGELSVRHVTEAENESMLVQMHSMISILKEDTLLQKRKQEDQLQILDTLSMQLELLMQNAKRSKHADTKSEITNKKILFNFSIQFFTGDSTGKQVPIEVDHGVNDPLYIRVGNQSSSTAAYFIYEVCNNQIALLDSSVLAPASFSSTISYPDGLDSKTKLKLPSDEQFTWGVFLLAVNHDQQFGYLKTLPMARYDD